MSDLDLLIRGDEGDLAVADGRIVAAAPELSGPAREEVDARGLLVLPGVVDAHVHLNEPGRTDWEGFATGTAALAAGGTTCAIDMPLNAVPPTIDGAAFDAKVAAATGVARVDVALWGGLVPGDRDRLDELAARGVVGFKAFMSASGVQEFEAADDLTLLEGMARAASLGLPVAVHAESEELTSRLARRAVAEGRVGVRDYLASRPVLAELEAIARAIAFAAETGCALHVVHVSSGRGVALVAQARARGVDVTCETCPHYLVLDADDAERLGAVAKCAPPLRGADEREGLWAALRAGDVDLVATDHSPAPAALKEGDDFFAVWGGIAGAQTLLALLHDEGGGPRPRAGSAGRPARRRARAALRPGAGQGRARGGRRRRRGARRPGGDVDGRPRGAARSPPAEPVRGPRPARPRGAHDPARAHDRARRPDRRRALRARSAARRLGLCAVSALDDAIAELARFNDGPEAGGITREVYTPTYATALEWVAERMRGAGLETRLDAVGNLFGRWEGSEPDAPVVVTGSHVDTTLNAGAYDGVLGVLGAIAAVRALREGGLAPRRSIEVVAWAGEEPRFGTGCVGSRAAAGELERADLDRLVDRDGTSMARALTEAGLHPDRLADARIDPAGVHALVELHIEQGIVLETHGEQVGVVTAIAAPHDFRLTFRGAATHAGATPMGLRRDALAGAAEAMVALERAARESPSGTTVGTVGVLRARPGAINVVPGEVELDVDVRDSDLAAREQVVQAIGRPRARSGRGATSRSR